MLRFGNKPVAQSYIRREPIMKYKAHVGFDVHAATITVKVAGLGRGDEGIFDHGTIPNRPDDIRKKINHLKKKYGEIAVCYEAGPCGYTIYWQLVGMGVHCDVVAPSLIPTKAGDQVKTDRRDAHKLAKYYRSGDLTPVFVPDKAHEALRDLVRAREAAKKDLRVAQHRLGKFLLRNGLHRPKHIATNWTQKHLDWIKTLKFEEKAQEIVYVDYLHEVEHQRDRLKALESFLDKAIEESPAEIREVVAALQMLRGVGKITAIGVTLEVGNFSRFTSPSKLMKYSGAIPSEHSSGPKRRQGSITKAGNKHLRTLMTEAAWSYRYLPGLNSRMKKCEKEIDAEVIAEVKEIAWKGQRRLCERYRTLCKSGKKSQVAITAVGRELLGFIWAIAVTVERRHVGAGKTAA